MPTSIHCKRVNHMNVVLEDFTASMDHFTSLYGAQFVSDMPQTEWHAGLFVMGRVLFELFAPYEFLLNSRYGPHFVGLEYETDLDEARQAIAERGIRISRDIGAAVHTHPADGFGVAFEFYNGNFHDAPRPTWREQMKPDEYWRDEHPLGLTGLKGYTVAVADVDAASDFFQDFLSAQVRSDTSRPDIAARAVGLEMADSTVELLAPVGDGAIREHVQRFGDGIRATVFSVRDLAQAERYFADRGVTLEAGDAPDRLAVPADANRGVIFEFSE
jgi:hypothetical protein